MSSNNGIYFANQEIDWTAQTKTNPIKDFQKDDLQPVKAERSPALNVFLRTLAGAAGGALYVATGGLEALFTGLVVIPTLIVAMVPALIGSGLGAAVGAATAAAGAFSHDNQVLDAKKGASAGAIYGAAAATSIPYVAYSVLEGIASLFKAIPLYTFGKLGANLLAFSMTGQFESEEMADGSKTTSTSERLFDKLRCVSVPLFAIKDKFDSNGKSLKEVMSQVLHLNPISVAQNIDEENDDEFYSYSEDEDTVSESEDRYFLSDSEDENIYTDDIDY